MISRKMPPVLAAVALLGLFGAERLAAQESFSWRGRLAAGQTIEVKGVIGDIRATPASGSEVEVRAVKRGKRDDPSEVRIEVVPHGDGVTICALYPPSTRPNRGRQEPNECAPGEGGRLSSDNHDVRVDFEVRVPAGVNFAGRTVSGGVVATGLRGDVVVRSVSGAVEATDISGNADAATVSGSVRISASGYARGSTVSGSVDARMGRADWRGEMEMKTVSGGITVELPANANTHVSVRTMSGSISSDFPLRTESRFLNRSASGTIGSGGRDLTIETVSGTVRIRRGS
jgi:hypothetical protein